MGAGNFEYGIATNYRQFVLIDKAQGYARHHLFDFLDIRVDKSKLKQFIAVFSRGNILEGSFIPSLYRESQVEERAFTTEFYQLFHRIRLRLIGEFEAAGGTSKEDALHYAQLILNRLVFVFFASGTGKLRAPTVCRIHLEELAPRLGFRVLALCLRYDPESLPESRQGVKVSDRDIRIQRRTLQRGRSPQPHLSRPSRPVREQPTNLECHSASTRQA